MDNKTQTGSGLFRTFRQLFSLRCTTKTNMLIYAIRQIPLLSLALRFCQDFFPIHCLKPPCCKVYLAYRYYSNVK